MIFRNDRSAQMPIFKINNKLILFTHIPKCGGTSIETYFLEIGAKISFYDNKIYGIPEEKRWNKSSPQHIDGASFQRLFSNDFFDHKFIICRHPLSRLKNAFGYHKFVEKTVDLGLTLEDFVQNNLLGAATEIGKLDHHFKPQYTFLPSGWTYDLFKFETGMTKVKQYIDMCALSAPSLKSMPHSMKAKTTLKKVTDSYLSNKSIELVQEIYSKDFELFGYQRERGSS